MLNFPILINNTLIIVTIRIVYFFIICSYIYIFFIFRDKYYSLIKFRLIVLFTLYKIYNAINSFKKIRKSIKC